MIWFFLKKTYLIFIYPAILLKIFLDYYLHKVEPETEVFNNLYQGRYYFFKSDLERLKNKNIECVIDLTCEFDNKSPFSFFKQNNITYYNFKTWDWRPVKKEHLENILGIIDKNLWENKKVLVNCAFWHRRSFQWILYYLIKIKKHNFNEAFSLVKNKRIVSNLNCIQLKKFKQYL